MAIRESLESSEELMKAIKEAILEGPDSNKVFRHDISLLHKKTYETCGTLVAWSILNGGPGLPVFNTDLFSLMTGGDIDVQDFTSVVDSDVRAIFLQIQEATTEEQFEEALSKNSDWLLNQGLAPYNLKIDRKDELLKILFKNEIYFRVHSEISQFIDGLNRVGNFHTSAILRAAKEFKTLFTPNPVNHLTFSGLRQMYKIEFSPVGSNHRQQEDEAIYCFESFCSDCEAGILEVSLEDLLAFWTGASEVPPLGFDHKLRITFNENSQYLLPIAHTCTLVIRLWRGYNDPDQFRCDMIKAITWTGGFHLA
uniref:G2/M phase-specific E3 ubiquitin-protein ligase n=1 Tax=Magallana gigas TaxID=29159 RepID=K1Q5Z4_MAGGI